MVSIPTLREIPWMYRRDQNYRLRHHSAAFESWTHCEPWPTIFFRSNSVGPRSYKLVYKPHEGYTYHKP